MALPGRWIYCFSWHLTSFAYMALWTSCLCQENTFNPTNVIDRYQNQYKFIKACNLVGSRETHKDRSTSLVCFSKLDCRWLIVCRRPPHNTVIDLWSENLQLYKSFVWHFQSNSGASFSKNIHVCVMFSLVLWDLKHYWTKRTKSNTAD